MTGVQTCALPISYNWGLHRSDSNEAIQRLNPIGRTTIGSIIADAEMVSVSWHGSDKAMRLLRSTIERVFAGLLAYDLARMIL